jgi:RNA polymerase sigma-70 factor (ECF subfamily)
MAAEDAPRDDALMLAYAAGDAAAFDTLYERHKGGVYRYLLRQCGNAGLADEMFQDVWMNLIKSRGRYVPSASFATWLYTLAHNRLVDHYRASGRVHALSLDDDAHAELAESIVDPLQPLPEDGVAQRQLGERLKSAVSALPAAQREAFLLHQEGGLSLAEIAALTGAGEETVKSRLRYAMNKLRADLSDLKEPLPRAAQR